MTLFEAEHDWTKLLEPRKIGGELKFPVVPQTVIEHARRRGENYCLTTESEEDGVRYRVMKNMESQDDPTQSTWDLDYGVECRVDGRVRLFANYIPKSHDDREAAAKNASENQFRAFQERTDQYWAERYGA